MLIAAYIVSGLILAILGWLTYGLFMWPAALIPLYIIGGLICFFLISFAKLYGSKTGA